MAQLVLTNHAALSATRHLNQAHAQWARSIERLSSGTRITRASDGPADLAISEGMRSQISGLMYSMRGSQSAFTVTTVGDEALATALGSLNQLRDLALRASGNTISAQEKHISAQVVANLLTNLDRLGATRASNGSALLDGTYVGEFTIDGNGNTLNVAITTDVSRTGLGLAGLSLSGNMSAVALTPGKAHFGGSPATASTFTLDLPDDSAVAAMVAALADPATAVTAGGTAIDLRGVGTLDALVSAFASATSLTAVRTATGVELTSATAGPAPVAVSGLVGTSHTGAAEVADAGGNAAQVTAKVDLMDPAGSIAFGGGPTFTLGAAVHAMSAAPSAAGKAAALRDALQAAFAGASVDVAEDGTFTVTAGEVSDEVFTVRTSGAQVSLELIDDAWARVLNERAQLGATHNRFEVALRVQGTSAANLTQARERIVGLDMAAEVVTMQAAKIRAQAAMAMVAQARVAQGSALRLLLPS